LTSRKKGLKEKRKKKKNKGEGFAWVSTPVLSNHFKSKDSRKLEKKKGKKT